MKLTKFALAMTIALAGCSGNKTEHLKSLSADQVTDSIAPGEDFYLYVNQKWMNEHPLPGEYARFGNFDLLRDTAQERVRQLVTGLADTNPEKGTVAFKVATIYTQAMDSTRRNAEGAKPIIADLAKIENAPADSLYSLFLWMHKNFASPFFAAGPMEDMNNSSEYAMYIDGGGMSLGDRDYYLSNDGENVDCLL